MGDLQLSLFERAHRAAFELWLNDNPNVWRLFESFTFAAIKAGRTHYSADAICHRIRWHVDVETRDASGFKVNNNHVAFLARRFEQLHPQHARFFKTRVQRCANDNGRETRHGKRSA